MQDETRNESRGVGSPVLLGIGGLLLLFTLVAGGKYLMLFCIFSSFVFSFVGLALGTSLPQRIVGVILSGLSGGLCAIGGVIYFYSA